LYRDVLIVGSALSQGLALLPERFWAFRRKRNKNAWTGPIYLIGRFSANEGVVTDIAIFPRRRRRRRKCAGARR
jgi:hypothetical protein